jgi:hypothetical protein
MTAPTYIQFNPEAGTRTPVWVIMQPKPVPNPEPHPGVIGGFSTWMG